MQKLFLTAKLDNLTEGMIFIENALDKYKIKGKEKAEALLLAEENAVLIIDHAPDDARLELSVKKRNGEVSIILSAKGTEIGEPSSIMKFSNDEIGHDSEEAIRATLLQAFRDKISYARNGEYNFIKINAGVRERTFALRTVVCFAAAIAVGILMKLLCPQFVIDGATEWVLTPIQTLFLNALQLVSAPAVFFCIMNSVAKFASFTDPGKISSKIIIGYFISSVLSVIIGYFVFIGTDSLLGVEGVLKNMLGITGASDVSDGFMLKTITSLIPDNIIDPFSNVNGVQLLAVALLGGIALGRAGKYSKLLRDIGDAFDRFFSGMVEVVSNITPFAVFFVTVLTVLKFGAEAIYFTIIISLITVIGLLAVFVTYLIDIFGGAHLNPIIFIKKYVPEMGKTFWYGSGAKVIPDTMKICERKFGVPSIVSSFSIPFGAIFNLDGNCVYLTLAGLSLARLCGVDIFGRDIIVMAFMVVILSVGSPITPGSAMLALAMLMKQIGIPIVVISIMLGTNAVIEMLLAMFNVAGDVSTSIVVSRREGLLDVEKYNSKG